MISTSSQALNAPYLLSYINKKEAKRSPDVCVTVCTGGQCFVVNWLLRAAQAASDWSPVAHLCPALARVSGQKAAVVSSALGDGTN